MRRLQSDTSNLKVTSIGSINKKKKDMEVIHSFEKLNTANDTVEQWKLGNR